MSVDAMFEDLVLAVLAVNNFSLEKVFRYRAGLREQGVFEAKDMKDWSHETAFARLLASGYDRGPYYGTILASRLVELARFACSERYEEVRAAVAAGKHEEADAVLADVHGIGPAVLRNFWVLHG